MTRNTNRLIPNTRESQLFVIKQTRATDPVQKRSFWSNFGFPSFGAAKQVVYERLLDGTHTYKINDPNTGKFISCLQGAYSEENMVRLFETIPEVFAPIHTIAQTVSNGNFTLKRRSTGKEVTTNTKWNALLAKPNWRQDWRSLIYHMVVFKYVCGNRYINKLVPGTLKDKFDNVSAIWCLPSQYVWPILKSTRPKLYSTTSAKDIIETYQLRLGMDSNDFKPEVISHDTFVDTANFSQQYMKGSSPLQSCDGPMSNLMAVYEARNVIYTKRGALGFIVSKKVDSNGSIAITKTEKGAMRDEMNADFGVTGGRDTLGILDVPVEYVNVGLSIKDLEPFAETEADAAAIYGALPVPFELAPKPKGTTFDNQAGAQKKLYQDVSIPEGNLIASLLTDLLKMDDEGLFVDVSYDHVECLQEDKGKKADRDKTNGEMWLQRFTSSACTLNDWINANEGATGVGRLYDTKLLDMTPDEREQVKEVITILKPSPAPAQQVDANGKPINKANNDNSATNK